MCKLKFSYLCFILLFSINQHVAAQIILSENFDAAANCSAALIAPQCLPGWGASNGSPNPTNPGGFTFLVEDIVNLSGPAAMIFSNCLNSLSGSEGLFVNLEEKLEPGNCYKISFLLETNHLNFSDGRLNLTATNGLVHAPVFDCSPPPVPSSFELITSVDLEPFAQESFSLYELVTIHYSPEAVFEQLWFLPTTSRGQAVTVIDNVKIEKLSCDPNLEFTDPIVDIPDEVFEVSDYILAGTGLSTGLLVNNDSNGETVFQAENEILLQNGTCITVKESGSFHAFLALCEIELPEGCTGGGGHDGGGTSYTVMDNSGVSKEFLSSPIQNGYNYEGNVAGFDFTIYPNPTANKQASIRFKDFSMTDTEINLKIFNTLGQLVFSQNDYFENDELDLSVLDAGIYLVQISNARGMTATQKLHLLK